MDATELPPGGYHEVGVDFRLERPTVLELPVTYLGGRRGTGVLFDRVIVTPRQPPCTAKVPDAAYAGGVSAEDDP